MIPSLTAFQVVNWESIYDMIQEHSYGSSDTTLTEKLKTTETLCEELMEENESLKNEVKDLQQEIEEMQVLFYEKLIALARISLFQSNWVNND